jgi:ACS family tartrate transporter-like MFS transporter
MPDEMLIPLQLFAASISYSRGARYTSRTVTRLADILHMALAPSLTVAPAAQIVAHTRHQTALRLLPFLFVLYITNYLDRTSLAYAAIGMRRDLGFSDSITGFAIGVFFISYVALQIPGALLVERWSARRVVSITMVAWGAMTALTALVHTPIQLYAARFLLGAAEAGFFPGVIVYLSHWFLQADRAKATSNFMSAIPLSFVLGSPLAGLILGESWYSLAGWRWLFILEGMPAVVLGTVAYFFLTDLPQQANWLTSEQRTWLESSLQEERQTKTHGMPALQALRSRTILVVTATYVFCNFTYYSLLFWLPSMMKRLTSFSDMRVGLLGALPYVAAFLALLLNGWHSDKQLERRWHTAVPVLLSAVGFFGLLLHPQSPSILLVFFTLASVGNSYLPVLWSIPTEYLSKSAAAAAVGMVNALGSIPGFLGPYLFGYLSTKTGSFTSGIAVLMCTALAGGLLIFCVPSCGKSESTPSA